MSRARLLSGTALGFLLLTFPGQVMAACDSNTPAAGTTVTCTGADTVGISGGANNVTVAVNPSASITTTGTSAISLGTNTNITVQGSSVTSNAMTININSGDIFINGTSPSVSSSTGTAINFGGASGATMRVFFDTGSISGVGTAINFGESRATLQIGTFAGAITGNVTAGSGTLDLLRLNGSGTQTFNASEIGTKYTGFDSFEKNGTGTWTLSGTGNQNWSVAAGTLQGDTTSMSGNLAVSSGANVTFNQSTGGTTSGIISGAGSLTKTGNSTLVLTGTNTYSGGTTISGTNDSAINVSADNNLGAASGTLTLDGGQLQYGASFNSTRNITLTNGTTSSINVQGFNSTLSGVISGSGSFGKNGTGLLTLTGTNTFTGDVGIYNGTLNVNADANLGTGAKNIYIGGATLQFASGFTTSKQIVIGTSPATIDTNGNNATLSGQIRNAGGSTAQLIKTGAGTLSLRGTNTYSGGTTISGGIVNITADNQLGSGALTFNGGTLQLGGSVAGLGRNIVLAGNGNINTNGNTTSTQGTISGAGNLTKSGTGTLIIANSSSYTGNTSVTGGTLQIAADNRLGAASGTLTLNNGTLQLTGTLTSARDVSIGASGGTINTGGNSGTLNGVVSGSGRLTKSGSGTLTLSGTNTYTGGTTISGGVLSISDNSNLGATSGGLTLNGGTLQQTADITSSRAISLGASNGVINTQNFGGTYSGVISGTGSLTKTGSGTMSLTGANTYTGGTTVSAGNLRGNTTSLQGNITNNANVTFNQVSTAGTYSGIMSGTGTLTKEGASTLILSGTNTYTGGTLVSAGTLQGNTTSIQGNITNNANIVLNQTTTGTYSGVMSGTGSFEKAGTGYVTLSGANTYTGGTTITDGTLQISTASIQGNIANSAALNINQSSNGTYAGIISGSGRVSKNGTGTVTLTGTNTYSGGTTISGGILSISDNNNLGATSGGLTFNGGTLQQTAAITSSRAISLGASGGTIDTQNFNSTYDGIISGAGRFTKIGSGALTLSGANTYTGGTTINNGTIIVGADNNLGASSGNISMNGGILQYSAGFETARNLSVGFAVINTNGFNSTMSGVISGVNLLKNGSGILTLSGANTLTGSIALSAGTLSVSADNNLGASSASLALEFGSTLQYGSGFTSNRNVLVGQGSGGIINTNGFDSTLSGVVSGSGRLTKSGSGTLTLSGNNTYTGGTTISGGTVNIDRSAALGALAGNLTMSGGTLQMGATVATARNIILSSGTGTVDTNGFNFTSSGIISGSGAFVKTGSGTITLSGENTYTGGTIISAGTLNVSAENNLGAVSSGLTLNGGTLQYGSGFSSARNITLTSSGGTINTNGYNSTISSTVSGTGSLTKTGSGTLTLTGVKTYTGGTTVSAGTLAGSIGTGTLTLLNNAAYSIGQTTLSNNISLGNGGGTISNTSGGVASLSGVISGVGGLRKTGANSLRLEGNNTYTGGTFISGGALRATADNNLGDASGDVTFVSGGAGSLQYDAGFTSARSITLSGDGIINTNGFDSSLSGIIAGGGRLIKSGTGTLVLSGTNIYSGGTTISDGTLQGTTSSLQGNIINNAAIAFNQTGDDIYAGMISGTGSFVKDGSGNVTLSGGNTYSGGTTINAGTLSGNTYSLQGDIINNANLTFDQNGSGIYAGDISGTGAVTKTGTAEVVLTGVTSHTGGTFVTGGMLTGTTDNLQGNIDNNAIVRFDQLLAGMFAGDMTGSGILAKYGAGTLTLTGTNTYSGGTVIAAGTLQGNTDSIQGDIQNDAALVFDQTANATFVDDIFGTGSLTKEGTGIITFTGTNSYTGGTTISGGGLIGNTLNLQGDILNNGALTFDQNIDDTYADAISGTGTLTKTGNGHLILTGANSYTGGTSVTVGKLSVNGTIVGTTTVDTGAALGGDGNFGALVINGRAAPGNSIGTMNVTGPVTFNAGSFYDVEVDASGNSDRIIATGALIINGGTVNVSAASGTYADTTNYLGILQGSSRTGTFSGVTTDLAFLTPTLSYTSTAVNLTLNRNDVDFNVVAADAVQAGVADAVQGLGSGNDLYTAFSGLNMAEATQALDTLSGEHNAGTTTATYQSANAIRNVISSHTSSMRDRFDTNDPARIQPAAGDDDAEEEIPTYFWTEGFGTSGHTDAKGTAPAQNRESGGALFGGEAAPWSDIYIGAFGGYEKTEIYTDSQFANSDVDTWHAGIYASYYPSDRWRLSGALTGGFHQIDTTRHIAFTGFSETPKGETNGYTISPSIETGYAMHAGGVELEPYAGLSVTTSHIDGYTEEQGGSANLDVSAVDKTNAAHSLGIRGSKTIGINDNYSMNVKANGGWTHTYGELSSFEEMRFASGALPFEVKGASIARNAATYGAGVDLNLHKIDGQVYLNYSGVSGGGSDDNNVTAGFKMRF